MKLIEKGVIMRGSLSFSLAAVLCVVLSAASSTLFAAVVTFRDDFNKANQALLGTTPNVGGTWAITGTSVVNPLQIAGNAVPMTTTGQDAFSAFAFSVPATAGTSMHTSMDINLSAVATNDYFSHVSDPAGTTNFFFQRLGANTTTGGYFLNLTETGGGATTSGTTVLNLNQTYHVDVLWNFVAGPTNDTFQVLVNNVPYLNKTWAAANPEPAQVSAANLRQGATGSAPTLTIDNYQVEGVPEPATAILGIVLGLFALAVRRSRG
jgi:hypothetical protein